MHIDPESVLFQLVHWALNADDIRVRLYSCRRAINLACDRKRYHVLVEMIENWNTISKLESSETGTVVDILNTVSSLNKEFSDIPDKMEIERVHELYNAELSKVMDDLESIRSICIREGQLIAEQDVARFFESNLQWDLACQYHRNTLAFANTEKQAREAQHLLDKASLLSHSEASIETPVYKCLRDMSRNDWTSTDVLFELQSIGKMTSFIEEPSLAWYIAVACIASMKCTQVRECPALNPIRLALHPQAYKLITLLFERNFDELVKMILDVDWSLDPLLYRIKDEMPKVMLSGIMGHILGPYQNLGIDSLPDVLKGRVEEYLDALRPQKKFYHVEDGVIRLDGASDLLARLIE